MSRAQWPSPGMTITLMVSYDGQQSWVVGTSAFIAPGTTSAKDPVLADALIGFGWGRNPPTHAKVITNSPSAFRSNVTIEAD